MNRAAATSWMTDLKGLRATSIWVRPHRQLGEIVEVIVDRATGQLAYAVVGLTRERGGACRLLPWTALRFDCAANGFFVYASQKAVERGPTLGPSGAIGGWSRDFEQQVHNHYSALPYWWS
jgi:hypothetical protein